MVGIIILAVLIQSIFFLVRAIKRANQKNMDKAIIKKTIISSALFTIAPAIAIVVGVVSLSKSLGVAVPWLRLSIIGSLSYELIAAQNALTSFGVAMGEKITDPQVFVTVVWVMTIGIITGLVLPQLLTKKIQKGLIKIENKDKKWAEIFNNAMFLGMISAFLGYVFCDLGRLWLSTDGVYTSAKGEQFTSTSGLVPVCVMLSSTVVMLILGLIAKKTKARWINDYALPICLIVGMALAIPFTALFGGKI
jgi:hypothetical protein